jgi:dipeptidyl aminopeptidase/acylaminoacyl peptidase
MQETAVKFKNEGAYLHGMIHLPSRKPPYPAVVFLHGYAGNRIGDHCIFVKAARDMCAHGVACLRFDFRGSGESEGSFAEMTLEGEIADAMAAIDLLSSFKDVDPDRIGLVGLSLGGSVAVCVSARREVASLALWAPAAFVEYLVEREGRIVKDPYAWLPENYSDLIKKRGWVDIGGFLRGKPYFESLKRVDPLREISKHKGPVLIIHGSEDEVISPVNSELMYDSIQGIRRLIVIDDADHTFSSAYWENQVIEETRRWFEQTL